MKKLKKPSVALLLATMIFTNTNQVFAQDNVTLLEESTTTEENYNTVVNIPDQRLKEAINKNLNKSANSDITLLELRNCKKLDLSGSTNYSIQNLEGLQYCTNLQELNLQNNNITDISKISNLSNLLVLNLSNNPIKDITPLSGLSSLVNLNLSKTYVDNLSSISNLTYLEYLDISQANVKDISMLNKLTRLIELRMFSNGTSDYFNHGRGISDISVLANFKELKVLDARDNNISDFRPLSTLTNLKDIKINNQKLYLSPLFTTENKIQLSVPQVFKSDGNLLDLSSVNHKYTLENNMISISDLTDTKDIQIKFADNLNTYSVTCVQPVIKLVSGIKFLGGLTATSENPATFEIDSKEAVDFIFNQLSSINSYKFISVPSVFENYKYYRIELIDYKFGKNSHSTFYVNLKVDSNNKQLISILDDKYNNFGSQTTTPNSPTTGTGNSSGNNSSNNNSQVVNPSQSLIKPIVGIVVEEGTGSQDCPVSLLVLNENGLDELLSELSYNFNYQVLNKPIIKDNSKIYNLKISKKGVNSSYSYIQIKISLNKVDMIKTIDYTLKIDKLDELTFVDIENHWAKGNIEEFVYKGYISGYTDKTFRPQNSMTRAEFITIINKVFNFTETGYKNFSDVCECDWFYKQVLIATKAGYINGYSDNTFKPNQEITREEACSIISNVMGISDSNYDKIQNYTDFYKVSNWAKSAVEIMLEKNYLEGYSDITIKPQGNITRAEVVSLLSKVIKK